MYTSSFKLTKYSFQYSYVLQNGIIWVMFRLLGRLIRCMSLEQYDIITCKSCFIVAKYIHSPHCYVLYLNDSMLARLSASRLNELLYTWNNMLMIKCQYQCHKVFILNVFWLCVKTAVSKTSGLRERWCLFG